MADFEGSFLVFFAFSVNLRPPSDADRVLGSSGRRKLISSFFCPTDSNSPTWTNNLDGQVNLRDAVRRQIAYKGPNGKEYKLNDGKIATLLVR
jgi:hypothetical protein